MGYTFTPPVDNNQVSRIADFFGVTPRDAEPAGLALAKYFKSGNRGRNVWVMNDGSVTEVQPPNWDGTQSDGRAVNASTQNPFATSFTYIGGAGGTGSTTFTNPANQQVRSFYPGGHTTPVQPVDVVPLQNAGYTLVAV